MYKKFKKIDDIITYCGGDNSNGFVWNELKYADFSYNNLKTIDTSLEFAQWLQQLNLSNNQLISCEAIKWLPNLKILNLSFNRLQTIPIFHLESTKRLQILILNHNFIENLNGLQRLDALIEFDLSNNCLLDHTLLLPLNTLITLKYLNLYGNPLYCHPNHRQATSYYLHKNTASVKFILDSEPLTKIEKQFIGNYQRNNQNLTTLRQILITNSTLRGGGVRLESSSGKITPQNRLQGQTPSSSVGSITSFKLNSNEQNLSEATTTTVTTQTNEMITSVNNEKQKKLRRRTVDLLEQNQNSPSSHSITSSTSSTLQLSSKNNYSSTSALNENNKIQNKTKNYFQ